MGQSINGTMVNLVGHRFRQFERQKAPNVCRGRIEGVQGSGKPRLGSQNNGQRATNQYFGLQ